jgi:cell division septation protein DedD
LPQVSPASASATADVPASSSEAASQVKAALPEPSAEVIETPPEEPPAAEKPVEKKAVAKKPVEKKATAKKAKPAAEEQTASLGAEPVVLVPPAASGEASQAAAQVQAEEPAKSGSFFDFSNFGSNSGESPLKRLKGKSAEEPTTARRATSAGAANEEQIASVEPQSFPDAQSEPAAARAPEPAPAPAPAPEPEAPAASSGGGSGFVAQLASFRSEAEAVAEFNRLKSRHPSILGSMSSRISKGTVAGVTRYRLGVGPMGDKASADGICNKLIAAGERDCLAKRL